MEKNTDQKEIGKIVKEAISKVNVLAKIKGYTAVKVEKHRVYPKQIWMVK